MRKLFALRWIPLIAATLNAQVVTGSVRDLGSGDPLYGAVAALIGSDNTAIGSVQTDSLGFFKLAAPAAGAYRLRVSRIGFAPFESPKLILSTDSLISRDVFLKSQPVRLSTVDINERPVVTATAANPHKFDLFLERRARGFGFFLTHDQIKTKNVYKLAQLLQSVPGIKVRQDRTRFLLQSQRCSGKSIPGMGDDPSRRPLVFIDGHLTKGVEQLDFIDPSQVEGLEVYQGGAELPGEAIGQACFAIFIWLRTIGP